MLTESNGSNTLPVRFSDKFKQILQRIEKLGSEIATRLLWSEGDSSIRTFIDIDKESNNKITYVMSNKVQDIINREDNLNRLTFVEHDKIYNSGSRSNMGINKFINILYNKEYETKKLTDKEKIFNKENNIVTKSQHLEFFVNKFKAIRTPGEIVEIHGSDIKKWYLIDNYETKKGTLGQSCMASKDCNEFMDFYIENDDKLSLLIMKSKEDDKKIIGRAMLWNLNVPGNRIFMDRVYVNNDFDFDNFIQYAIKHKYLYRLVQNSHDKEIIIDPISGKESVLDMVVDGIDEVKIDTEQGNGMFPFLDTLKYYSPITKELTNKESLLSDDKIVYKLESEGGYDIEKKEFNGKYRKGTPNIEWLTRKYTNTIIRNPKLYLTKLYDKYFWDYVDSNKYMEEYNNFQSSYSDGGDDEFSTAQEVWEDEHGIEINDSVYEHFEEYIDLQKFAKDMAEKENKESLLDLLQIF